jgi:hypothetical protein
MTNQQRADEFLSVWQAMRAMGLTPERRHDLIDRLIAEERFFRAFHRTKVDIGAMRGQVVITGSPKGR